MRTLRTVLLNKRLLIFATLIVALALTAAYLWRSAEPAEPVYEGRPLSLWLESHVASSAANPPYNSPGWKHADQVLRQSGTNAIPTLLKMIGAEDPPRAVLKGMEWIRSKRLLPIRYRYAYARNEEALYAFEVLGTNAAPAVPKLIKIYERARSPNAKRCAASALGHIGRPAQSAVPVLLRDFTHTNSDVRFYAVSAVIHMHGDPAVVVPAMCARLKDTKVETRWNASVGLSMFGRRADSAVPALQEALDDATNRGNKDLKRQLETAIWRIAPAKVGLPLVIEDSTPAITNGVTSEVVEVEYKGERKPFVPAGQRVPCLRQFYDSAPRSPLMLYRRAGKQDRFLGEFETIGIASLTNANVSLLCVIADGRIVLCARDNTSNEFLEIRRIR